MDPIQSHQVSAGGAADGGGIHDVAVELDHQPGGPAPAQAPQKRPVNALGLAKHIIDVACHVVALPFYAVLAPGFLLGSLFANALIKVDDENAPPLFASMLTDVIHVFRPLTNQITGIYAASQGMTLKEYRREVDEEAARNESFMNSMQLTSHINQVLQQARQQEAQNPPPALSPANINTKDQFGLTPLMKAATPDELRDRLAMGAKVDEQDEQGLTALERFAYSGEAELVAALLGSNRIKDSSDCVGAEMAVSTILEYENDAEARLRYQEILRALRDYKPPQPQHRNPPAAAPPQTEPLGL